MSTTLYGQTVGLCAAVLLLTAVLLVWRRSLRASIRLLAVQGVARSFDATMAKPRYQSATMSASATHPPILVIVVT